MVKKNKVILENHTQLSFDDYFKKLKLKAEEAKRIKENINKSNIDIKRELQKHE